VKFSFGLLPFDKLRALTFHLCNGDNIIFYCEQIHKWAFCCPISVKSHCG
jgi:hypothetical protein